MTRRDLERLLRPLANRIANTVARAVVHLVNDSTALQLLQVGVQDGEDLDGAERVQQYGFSSRPLKGAQAVAVFPNGDHGVPLVVAVDDGRHRPRDSEPGEVVVYNHTGAQVRIKASGDIGLRPAPGRRVEIRDDNGNLEALDQLVHGRGIDPWSGQTYFALGNTSAHVRAKK